MNDETLNQLKNQVQYLTDDSSNYNTQKKQNDLEKALNIFNNYNLHTQYKNKIKNQKTELSKLDKEVKSLKNIVKTSSDLNNKIEYNENNNKLNEEKTDNQSTIEKDNESNNNNSDIKKDDADLLKSFDSLIGGNKLNYYEYLPFLNNYYFDLYNNNYDYTSLILCFIYHILSIVEIIIIFMLINNNINIKLIFIIIFYTIIKINFDKIKPKKTNNKQKEINIDLNNIKNMLINPTVDINKDNITERISIILNYYKNILLNDDYKKLFYYRLILVCSPILILSIVFYYTECIITSLIILLMLLTIFPYRILLINILDKNLNYKTLWDYSKYIEIIVILLIFYKIIKLYSNKFINKLDLINFIYIVVNDLKKNFIIKEDNILVKEFKNIFIK